jgi:hypothetical protein
VRNKCWNHNTSKPQYSDAGHRTSPGRDDRQPVLPRPRPPTFFPTVSDDRHDRDVQSVETDETHEAYSFYDGLPSPRWRLMMVVAVLGLAGLGVASAFSYLAVFGGGAVLPTLPPLMAADNGPKKILPNYGDARPSNSSQTSSAGSSEKFASRWSADNPEPPKAAPISSEASAPAPAVAPPGGYGTICTCVAFARAEEGPHDHHPLRRVGVDRYFGRSCRLQYDERQVTRDAVMIYLPA